MPQISAGSRTVAFFFRSPAGVARQYLVEAAPDVKKHRCAAGLFPLEYSQILSLVKTVPCKDALVIEAAWCIVFWLTSLYIISYLYKLSDLRSCFFLIKDPLNVIFGTTGNFI